MKGNADISIRFWGGEEDEGWCRSLVARKRATAHETLVSRCALPKKKCSLVPSQHTEAPTEEGIKGEKSEVTK